MSVFPRSPLLSWPLWVKLGLAGMLMQLLLLASLMGWGVTQATDEMIARAAQQVATEAPLLEAALRAPLLQRNYAELQEILDEIGATHSFVYLVLVDRDGRRIAAYGMDDAEALPALDGRFAAELADARFDTRLEIELAGVTYGRLHYGLDIAYLHHNRERILRTGLIVGIGIMLLSLPLFALLGFGLTRRLAHLTRASHALADGRFDVALPFAGQDEVGRLAQAYLVMVRQLQQRLDELRASEQRFYAIANFTYDLELWIDPAGRTIWVNPSALRMTGYSAAECLAMPEFPLCLVAAADRDEAERRFAAALHGASGEGYRFRMLRKDGGPFWVAVNWQPIRDAAGQPLGLRASLRDVSEQKEAEHQAQEYLAEVEAEQARLMALLSAMNLGILFVGRDGRAVYHNPAFARIWQLREGAALEGVQVEALPGLGGARLMAAQAFIDHAHQALMSQDETAPFEIAMQDGRILHHASFPVLDRERHFLGHLWVFEDITGERQTAQQLVYLAERDSLTGLYNRHRFQLELERMLAEAERNARQVALLYFDLDEFKAINDHFGHKAGDAMLVRVAGEVSSLTRRHELFFRLGGDEFALLLADADLRQVQTLAERVVRGIAQIPFRFDGQTLHISSSLGIALFPGHAADQEELVVRADAAMYQAKQAGKNAWRLYRKELDNTPEMVSRLSWNERLNRALEQGLFELHFQGVYHTGSGELAHLEALIRLRDEHSGELVSPAQFIPVAEKSQKILEIDRWVLDQAVELLAARPQAPRIAVNISGRSFDDPSLPGYIVDLLREFNVAPQRLIIEITETAAVSDLTDAERFIEALKQAGCGVCLDDFGAGFASFAYLKHIRVDAIKLDGMFIRNLPHDHENQVFVRGMVEVARGLGKTTVAECVEDEATLALLARLGVDKAQGYYLGRPQALHPALYASAERA